MSGFVRECQRQRQTRRALTVQEVTCTYQEDKRKEVGRIMGETTVSRDTLFKNFGLKISYRVNCHIINAFSYVFDENCWPGYKHFETKRGILK